MLKLPLFVSALTFLMVSSDPARALPTSGEKPSESTSERGLSGFELSIRPGYGSASASSPVTYEAAPLAYHPDPGALYSGSAAPYGAGFAGQAAAGYRFLPIMSAGAYAETRSSSVDALDDGSSDVSRSAFGLGIYGRGYAPMLLRDFDPYLELGVGYVKDTQSYRRNVATTVGAIPGDWRLTHHGVAVPVTLGVSYRVLPMLALGPSVRYAYVFGAGACLKESVSTPLGGVSSSNCSDASSAQRVTRADSYGVWSAGLDLRLTL